MPALRSEPRVADLAELVDERIIEGIRRFPNARYGAVTNMHVQEDKLVVQFDIPDVEGASAGRRDVWEWLAARGDVPFRTYNDDEDPRFPKRGGYSPR